MPGGALCILLSLNPFPSAALQRIAPPRRSRLLAPLLPPNLAERAQFNWPTHASQHHTHRFLPILSPHFKGARHNEGLNVVEQWNSANDFIFFARRGEMVSNRRGDHEINMLALHLLQNCMVYINKLMLQQVLAQPHWSGKLTARDLSALTPLFWERVNPYGRFELDMDARLPID